MTSSGVKIPEVNRKDVAIELPTGKMEKIDFNDQSTVRELKLMCELKFGIPSNLQTFTMGLSSPELQDWCAVEQALELRRSGRAIKLEVPVWWKKIVCAALNREVENLSRRSQLPMQQITKEQRSFVALFIGCCLGDENMISQILLLDIRIASNTSTEAGRTLLHAAAAGGNIKCVDVLMKSWRDFNPELFNARDGDKEMPYDIAQRLGHKTMEELLYRYMNHDKDEKGERCSVESGKDFDDHSPTETRVFSSDEEGSTQSITPSYSIEISYISSGDARERLSTDSCASGECAEGLSGTARGNASVEMLPKANVTPERAGSFDSDVIAERVRASSPQSSDSSSEEAVSAVDMKTLQPNTWSGRSLLHRRLGRQHTTLPKFVFSEEEEDGEEQELTRLPALQENGLVSRDSRTGSASAHLLRWKRNEAHLRSSPHAPDSKSAPTSPQARRTAAKPTFPLSAPNSPELQPRYRRCSEPFGPGSVYSKNLNGGAMSFRRNSPQISAFSPPQPQSRRKSRSICAVTLNDALCDQWLEENEERLERPWNAWIAAKRKDSVQLTSPPPSTPEQLSPPQGANLKRMSFDQWLSEKDLEKLRQMYVMLSLENQKESKRNKQCKGKSFEEWMREDNLQEMIKQKQREKEGEKEQMEEELQRDRRRRVSQQRYDRWLKEKDHKALEEEEKQLREAKRQMKHMRKRWEEEDEKRKKRPTQRTVSCPTTSSPKITR